MKLHLKTTKKTRTQLINFILLIFLISSTTIVHAQCGNVNDTIDDQNKAGTDAWIGHLYTYSSSTICSGVGSVGPGNAFESYKGYLNEPQNFTEGFGGASDVACIGVANASAGGTTSILNKFFGAKFLMKNTTAVGCYKFTVSADDGVRLFINGIPFIDAWIQQGNTNVYTVTAYLSGNDNFELQYYECSGNNNISFAMAKSFDNILTTNINQTVCSGGTIAKILGNGAGSNSWQRSADGGASYGASLSTANDYQPVPIINSTSAPITYYFRRSVIKSACTDISAVAKVLVNPTPTVNKSVNQVLCNRSSTIATNFSGIATKYTWVNNNTAIGLPASGTGNIGSFTAINTSNAPITATITVTPIYTNEGISCAGETQNFTITVNPTPTVNKPSNQVACNGALVNGTVFSGAVAGTVYNWVNDLPYIGLSFGGTGNIGSFVGINGSNEPITATITVTPVYTNGGVSCTGQSQSFTITINPTPTVYKPFEQIVCNGALVNNTNFSGSVAGTAYNWTNDTPSIGISSGTGNIGSFTGINRGNSPVYATITVTPIYANGGVSCTGPKENFSIIVNPTPTVNKPLNLAVCNGATVNGTIFLGAVAGTFYEWVNDTPSIGLSSNGTGNIGSFTGINTGNFPITATITVTPIYMNGGVSCTGQSQSFAITINPTPKAATTPNVLNICSGDNIAITIFDANSVPGTTSYSWNRDNSNITGLGGGNTNPIKGVLTNTKTTTQTTIFTATVTSQFGCIDKTTAAVNVTPTVNVSIYGNTYFCGTGKLNNTTILTAKPVGGMGVYSYQWYLNGSPIEGATANTLEAGLAGNYTVVITSEYCTATSNNLVVNDPYTLGGTLTVTPNPAQICGSSAVTFTASSTSTVGTINWYDDATSITPVTVGNTFKTPVVDVSTNYYVSRVYSIVGTNPVVTCETDRVIAAITKSSSTSTPIATGAVSICLGGKTNLAITNTCSGEIIWKDEANNIVGTGSSLAVSPTQTTTYKAICKVQDCSSDESNSIRVSISTTLQEKPTVPADFNVTDATPFLLGAKSKDIAPIKWKHEGSINDVTLVTPTATPTTYYARYETQTGCNSDWVPITVTLKAKNGRYLAREDSVKKVSSESLLKNNDNNKYSIAVNTPAASCAALATSSDAQLCSNAVFPALVNNNTNGGLGNTNWGCLGTRPNQSWFYFIPQTTGSLSVVVTNSAGVDVDGAIWGPVNTVADACTATSSAPLTCDYLASANVTLTIASVTAGKVYVVVITNYSNSPTDITFPANIGKASLACCTLTGASVAITTPIVCNGGTGGVTVTPVPATAGVTYTYSKDGTTFQSSGIFTGLTAGTYTFYVKDNTCTKFTTITLTQPTLTTVVTNVSCNNGTNGKIVASVSGGTGTIIYTISPSVGTQSPSGTFNNLTANTYTITAKDANNCTITQTATVTQPANLTFTFTKTDITSCVSPNGTITVTAAGGTSAYQYSKDNGVTYQASNVFSNLASGSYTIKVKDANGCESSAATVSINAPSNFPSVNGVQPTNTTCFNGTDGKITFSGTGGTSPYTYSITNGTSYQGTGTFTGLSAGTYQTKVKDANGCESSATAVVVNNPSAVTLSATATNVSCALGNNGKIVAVGNGGTGTIIYTISPSVGTQSPSGTFNNLTANTYTITAKDANNCTITQTATVTQPANLTFTSTKTDVTSCVSPNGTITVTAAGGTTAYQYSKDNGVTYQASNVFSNLASGSYTIKVKDANNCESQTTTTSINAPSNFPSVNGAQPTNTTCFNGTDGKITFNGTGGTPPYTYSITNGTSYQSTGTFTGLSAGTYQVKVKDANGCESAATAVVVNSPSAVTLSATATNVSCALGNSGKIVAVGSGGTGTITYSISPSVGTQSPSGTFNNLTANTYTITAKDANNCTITQTATVTQPANLTFTSTKTDVTSCVSPNGTITVTAAGGTTAYQYSKDNGVTYQASNVFSSLASGSYTIKVKDANGCESSVATVSINALSNFPSVNGAQPTNTTCFNGTDGKITFSGTGGTSPYTYSITNGTSYQSTGTFTGLSAGTYQVKVKDANGCESSAMAVVVNSPSAVTLSATATNVSCALGNNGKIIAVGNGGTGTIIYTISPSVGTQSPSGTFNNLTANTYTITAKDANGCTITANVIITEPSALSASTTQVAVLCQGGSSGSGSVTVSGGVIPYSYSWSPTGGSSSTASGLVAGDYTVNITDNNGCVLSKTIVITEPSALSASTTQVAVLCQGGSSGSGSVTVSGGVIPYSYSWSPTGGSSSTASGLGAGDYTVAITDKNGCVLSKTITITEPSALSASTTQVAVLCQGGSSGSGSVTVSGGVIPYSYSWSPTGGSSSTASGLVAGDYTVNITDNNGCVLSKTIVITEPSALSASTTQVAVLCQGGSSGSGSVTVSGGVIPYSYSWSPTGGSSSTASGLGAGDYTVAITDNNGCVLSKTIVITEPAALSASTTQVAVLCQGGSSGSGSVTVSGGVSPYSYSWSPTGGSSSTASGLVAGDYTVNITDNNGCVLSKTIVITEPSALSASTTQVAVLCQGGSSGSGSVTVSGGVIPYSYSWSPTGGSSSTASGLGAGDYTVAITDNNGCVLSKTITITEPSALSASTTQVAVLCQGGSSGSGSVTVSGGVSPYSYSWSPTGGSSSTASGLVAGDYTVAITDKNGCVLSKTITITEPTALSASTTQVAVLCQGGSSGSGSVTVSGGVIPYSYSWSPTGGSSSTASGLVAGDYTVNITDNNGCVLSKTIVITEPSALSASTTQVAVLCQGGSSGSGSVTVSGGVIPYSYSWSPTGGSSSTASGLGAGDYTVAITDNNGCVLSKTITITEPSALSASTTQVAVLCQGGSSGSGSVTVSGGVIPYSYSWSPTGGSSSTASGLVAGDYTVAITDKNGCVLSKTIVITEPAALSASTTQVAVLCQGGSSGSGSVTVSGGVIPYSYSWSPTGGSSSTASGLVAGDYTVNITDNNGCVLSKTIVITEPAALSASTTQVAVLCQGGSSGSGSVTVSGGVSPYSYSWSPTGGSSSTASGLGAGDYTVAITDKNGCVLSKTITITEPTALSASTTQVAVLCQGGSSGSGSVTVSGGVSPYSYSWSPTGGSSSTASGLVAGDYTVNITDNNGCVLSKTIVITEPSALSASTTQVAVLCQGGSSGSGSVTVSGGVIPYSYSWSPTGGSSSTASGLGAGDYTVAITDKNGCVLSKTITITEPSALSASTTQVAVLCQGGSSGSGSVTVSGGVIPYSYSWSPTGGSSSTASGLVAGDYTVNITDNNGCVLSKTIVITEPSALSASTTQVAVLCQGGSSGSGSVTVSGGVIPYSYSWSPTGGSSSTASGLGAGDYTVAITDNNGCVLSKTIVITEPAALSASTTQVAVLCQGGSSGSGSVTVSGGVSPYSYSWSPTGGSSSTASGLVAGDYTVNITDNNGCVLSKTIVITEPSALSASTTQVAVLCQGGSSGSGSVTVSGGVIPYSYSWSPTGGSSSTASGLGAGDYTVAITDNNGCVLSKTITITEPSALSASTTQVAVLCQGGSSGSGSVTVSGGVSPYSYSWSPTGGSSSTASGLVAGDYTVAITDKNGCVLSKTITITEPTALSASTTQVAVLCQGGSSGSGSVTVSGGVIPYSYSWSPTGGSSSTASGLVAGDYTVNITDNNGCVLSKTIVITEPSALSASTTQVAVLCQGGSSGSGSVTVSGGVIPYSYSWSPTGGSSSTASGLGAGDYTVAITDNNGCVLSKTITITEPSALSASTTQVAVLCQGGSSGSGSVTVSGGVIPYSYSWSPTGGSSSTASGLVAGDYTVAITDKNGCVLSKTIVITEPAALSASTTQVAVLCQGGSSGSGSVTVSGGVIPYSYSWSPTGGSSSTASGLVAGDYTVNITDNNGCVLSKTIVITEPAALSASTTQVAVLCQGGSSGSGSVTVSGGVSPYSYSWSPTGGSSSTASGLVAGDYTVAITDKNGCVLSKTITITEPAALSASTTQVAVLCQGGSSGSGSVTVSGGVSPYSYSWSPTGGSSSTASGLVAGDYTVNITDNNGCVLSKTIVITEPAALSASTTQVAVLCQGGSSGSGSVTVSGGVIPYSYSWSPTGGSSSTASGLGAGDYTVAITDKNGCVLSKTITITEPAALSASTTQVAVLCQGGSSGSGSVTVSGGVIPYSYSWSPTGGSSSTASGLGAGDYTVAITDNNGCVLSKTITITEPTALSASTTQVAVLCQGGSSGSGSVTVSGGVIPYSYSWSPTGGSSSTASGLGAGDYTVAITDKNGCVLSKTITITEPSALSASTTQVAVLCQGGSSGSGSVTVSGGVIPYSYSWSPTGGSSSTASGLVAGDYTVAITDNNGCVLSKTITITEPSALSASTTQVAVLCQGGSSGSGSVTVSGGVIPYSYSWSPTGGSSSTASGLGAGDYTVAITDKNGCVLSKTIVITEPSALSASTTQVAVLCQGGSSGSGSVTVSGGVSPYSYSWSPTGGSSSTASGLVAGDYTVNITDNNGCVLSKTIVITEPSALSASTTQVAVLCQGGSSGSGSVTVSGGVIPYSYSWSPTGGSSSTASGLVAGDYTVNITDKNGCVLSKTIVITEPSALSASTTQVAVLCQGGSSGSGSVTVSGGVIPYSYSWSPTGGSSSTASGLVAGDYTVNITDNNGCVLSKTIVITEPAALSASTTQVAVLCQGGSSGSGSVTVSGGVIPYSYSWSPTGGSSSTASGLVAGDYTVAITDKNGCVLSKTIVITEPAALSASTTQVAVLCQGGSSGSGSVTVSGGVSPYSYSWSPTGGSSSTASGLVAGDYTVAITDKNGCVLSKTIVITEPAALSASTTQVAVLCQGGSSGSGSVTVSGGVSPYSYSWSPTGGSSSTASGLVAGDYTVAITDNNGCVLSKTIVITEPAALSASTTQVAVLCQGGSSGSGSVTVSGGVIPYSYSWSPTGGSSSTASGLGAGDYTVAITDKNGCVLSKTITITEPSALSASTTQVAVLCQGGSSGSGSVTVSGGVIPYSYSWSPTGGSSSTASGLVAGDYTVNITDNNGCVLSKTIVITEPSALSASTTQVAVLCQGGSSGSGSVTVSGGVIPYSYSWSPTGGSSSTASGLGAGDYTVAITDNNGCVLSKTIVITEPAALSASTTQVAVLCQGGSSGSGSVTVSGGVSPYSYSWSPTGGSSSTASGLVAGDYTVNITDNNGCVLSKTIVITEPSALSASTTQVAVLCQGGSSGSGSVTVSGGVIPYSYSWSPTGGSSSTASGLGAGDYTVAITDNNGCVLSKTITITEPSALSASTTQVAVLCQGGSSGSGSVTVSGGVSPYSYSWSPTGGSSSTASGLVAGDYTVAITDKNGCVLSKTITITEPTALSASTTQVAVLCQGGSSGSGSVTVSGGVSPYSYSWSPTGGSSSTASGLVAGDYTVAITDKNGCVLSKTIVITEPAALSASTTQVAVLCQGGSSGSGSVTVSGGVSPYSYSWSPTGGSSSTASGLVAGDYTVNITDNNGCVLSKTIVITEPAALSASTTQVAVLCQGGSSGSGSVTVSGGVIPYSYSWSPTGGSSSTASGLVAGDYTVAITDKNGCVLSKTITITEPAALSASTTQVAVLCQGGSSGSGSVTVSGGVIPYSYSWSPTGGSSSTASGLVAGDYTVNITDNNGCVLSKTIVITEPSALSASTTQVAVLCQGGSSGSGSVTVSGGVIPYSYSWSPTGGSSSTASGLGAGDYTVAITDNNGCVLSKTITITEPSALSASTTQVAVLCQGGSSGSGSVTVSGGVIPYSYSWSPTGGSSSTASGLVAGDYTVNITDNNGCVLSKTITITEPSALSASTTQVAVLCQGGSSGSGSVTVSGGVIPYSYSWSPTGGSSSTASGLVAGDYTVVITDKNGCVLSKRITITEPSALSASTTQVAVLCQGGSSGSGSVMVSGGVSPYSYSWSPTGGSSSTASGLVAGDYTVAITDKNGCVLSKTIVITQSSQLKLVGISSNLSCNGNNSGSINLGATGGANNYLYSIDGVNFQTASSFNNLSAGVYTFTVKDANNCIATTTISLTEPTNVTTPSILGDITICYGQQIPLDKIGIEPNNILVWHATNNQNEFINGPNLSQIGSTIYYVSQRTNLGCESARVPITITIVDAEIAINSQPSGQSICKNESATFNVLASGNIVSYQWQKNGVNIIGANSATLILNPVSDFDAGDYTCIINGACKTIQSFTAKLQVRDCGCVDLALRKRLVCCPKTPVFKPNDLVKFEITVFNQCNIKTNKAYNINIVDYIPKELFLDTTNNYNLTWERSIDTLRNLDNNSIIRIDTNAVTCIDSLAGGDSTTISMMLRVKSTAKAGIQINKSEIFGADLDKYNQNHIIADIDSRFDKNPINDIGGKELSPTDDEIWGNGDGRYDIVGGINPIYDEDDEDPTLINIVTPKDTCLDLALRKRLVCNPAVKPLYMPNDLVNFEITVFNQCKTGKAYNIDIVDYVPKDMILEKTATTNLKWTTSVDTLRALYSNAIVRIDTNAVTCIDSLASGDSTTIEITLRIKGTTKAGVQVNKSEIFGADLDKECKSHFTHDIDSCFDKNPVNDPGGKELSPTDDDIWGDGDTRYDIAGGINPNHDEDDADPTLIVVGSIDCLAVSMDSVAGNKWYDLYDKNRRLFASINPNGQNLGKVTVNVHHYGNGEKDIPTTLNGTRLMSRYFDVTSSVKDSFETAISMRVYYLNSELEDYKTATKLASLTSKDLTIVRYKGINKNCQFEDNDNFNKGFSDVLYKDIKVDTMNCNAFYLQFNAHQLTEIGATANKYNTLVSFDAIKRDDKKTALITWQATLEVKADYYLVERSKDCQNFTLMSKILAKGINSTYSIIDSLPLIGTNCYRLTYVDKDGTHKVLDSKSLTFDNVSGRYHVNEETQKITEEKPSCKVYPNPVNNYSDINLYFDNIKANEIKLYSITGQEVKINLIEKSANSYQILPTIELMDTYFIIINDLNGKKCVVKVVAK